MMEIVNQWANDQAAVRGENGEILYWMPKDDAHSLDSDGFFGGKGSEVSREPTHLRATFEENSGNMPQWTELRLDQVENGAHISVLAGRLGCTANATCRLTPDQCRELATKLLEVANANPNT